MPRNELGVTLTVDPFVRHAERRWLGADYPDRRSANADRGALRPSGVSFPIPGFLFRITAALLPDKAEYVGRMCRGSQSDLV